MNITQDDVQRALIRFLQNNLTPAKSNPITPKNYKEYAAAWHAELSDLDIDLFNAACSQYIAYGTFFPSSGQIRATAKDLQLQALDIPTPAQAWAEVQNPLMHNDSKLCPKGAGLYDAIAGAPVYGVAVLTYGSHVDQCDICHTSSGFTIKYSHRAIEAAVRRMGGSRAIFTGYAPADRARFIDHYEEVIERGINAIFAPPSVKAYLESVSQPAALGTGPITISKLLGVSSGKR